MSGTEERNIMAEEAFSEHQKVLDFLGSIPLLQQLPGASVQKIAEVIKLIQFGRGEVLVREGLPGEGLYILWKGEAEVSMPTTGAISGHTVPLLGPGDYFGYPCAGPVKEVHKADVTAVAEVTCFILRHEHADLLVYNSIWTKQTDQAGVSLLERILQLETIEVDLYRAVTLPEFPSFGGNVFGGQLLGQALAAASKSVDPLLLVHSLHSYFLRTGDALLPIIYKVERTRNGHSFATRHVAALQKGHVIFAMYASFQRAEEGPEHQEPMPSAPPVAQVEEWEKVRQSHHTDPRVPWEEKKRLAANKIKQTPLELKYVDPADRVTSQISEPRQRVWMRAKGRLSDDQALQRCAAAYASDWTFLETALRPHRLNRGDMQVLSLDHSMWFHKPFRADEWFLYVEESPRASNARGLVFGHCYTESGELVISTAQEGMLRMLKKRATSKL